MQLFTGEVVFAADPQPYDAGYGPRYNVKVRLDQPAPERVRTDKEGRVTVFVRPTDSDAPFLRSLVKGDRVTLSWDDGNAKKTSMDLVVPAGFVGEAQPPLPAQTTQTYRPPAIDGGVAFRTPDGQAVRAEPPTWYPLADEEREAFLSIAGHSMDLAIILMSEAQVKLALAGFGEVSDLRVLQALAASGHIQAHKEYRRGMVVHKPATLDETESAFLAAIDNSSEDALVASVLDGVARAVGSDRKAVGELFKSFGLTRNELAGGQDSQLFLLNVARTYYEALRTENGSEPQARRIVEEKFNLSDASLF